MDEFVLNKLTEWGMLNRLEDIFNRECKLVYFIFDTRILNFCMQHLFIFANKILSTKILGSSGSHATLKEEIVMLCWIYKIMLPISKLCVFLKKMK